MLVNVVTVKANSRVLDAVEDTSPGPRRREAIERTLEGLELADLRPEGLDNSRICIHTCSLSEY